MASMCFHLHSFLLLFQIFDGFDDEAPDLGRFCGYTLPDPLFSTGNTISIKFRGDSLTGSRFYLHWSAANETGVRITEGNKYYSNYFKKEYTHYSKKE